MRVLMAMFAGAVACVVGAGIWTAVTYFTHYEIGWVAWGIGALTGLGVFLGSGRQGDFALGILAVLLALAGILLGKFGVAYASINAFASDDELYISSLADEVMYERNRNGESWPPISEHMFETAESISDVYPRAIWAEAEAGWNAMSEAQRQEIRDVPQLANKNYHLVYMADQLVDEYQLAGKPVNWPAGMSVEIAFYEEDYPPDLWADAVQRWDAMSGSEQASYRAGMIASERQRMQDVKVLWQAEGTAQAFVYSFSLFDGLWAILAILSAYKLGSANDDAPATAA